METLGEFLRALGNREYLFLWLEPLLTWGVLFGLLAFLFGQIIDEKRTQAFGLVVIIGSSLAITPYLHQRSAAQDRIVSIFEKSEPQRASGFVGTTEKRRRTAAMYYLTALCATLILLIGGEKNRLSVTLLVFMSVFCIVVLVIGNLLHFEDSRVFHPNLFSQP